MPKQEGQKSKLLALLRIFEQQTDENHLLNVAAAGGDCWPGRASSASARAFTATSMPSTRWATISGCKRGRQRRLLDGQPHLRPGRAQAAGGRRTVQPGDLQIHQRQAHQKAGRASPPITRAASSSARSMSMAAPRAPTRSCLTAWMPCSRPSTRAGWYSSATKK